MRFCTFCVVASVLFLLGGCAIKEIQKQKAAFIVLKSPALQYADMGFLSQTKTHLIVQIYSNAQPMLKLDIYDTKICMSRLQCMSKKNFNTKFLDASYPDETLENILLGKPIFDSVGYQKIPNGFIQKIQNETHSIITYEVLGKSTVFRDTIKNITIKVTSK